MRLVTGHALLFLCCIGEGCWVSFIVARMLGMANLVGSMELFDDLDGVDDDFEDGFDY